ncbi:hypothetical protein ACOZ4L_08485 [Haloplanus ruber]|uniref:DUF8052 domain-containing protein n=1 Tax=Haloplanus ruber TaxID=869892 RepID=A0ABD6CVL9_9EURY|nr:hypothetical protein [Haloplanus ruber]
MSDDPAATTESGPASGAADPPEGPADRAPDDDWGAPEEVRAADLPEEVVEAVPDWPDDPYLDRVSDRLMHSYDLDKDAHVAGERWDLYGELRVVNQKQFVHPALSYADHESEEYLFARRVGRPTVADLERLVDLGHDVADERVTGHEEHYRTDVTFVLVADEIPDDVREFVVGFRDRTLLKFGYYGHYEVNLIVVAPARRTAAASEVADAVQAFALWEDLADPDPGLLDRIARRFWS